MKRILSAWLGAALAVFAAPGRAHGADAPARLSAAAEIPHPAVYPDCDGRPNTAAQPCSPPLAGPSERVGQGAVALRLSGASVRDGSGTNSSLGLSLAGSPEMQLVSGTSSTRIGLMYAVGGGSGGFEGALGLSFTTGSRLLLAPHQGFFGRIGAGGYMVGNELFYQSLLSLPIGEVGYQVLNADARLLLDLGFRGGPSLTGRLNVLDGSRRALGGGFLAGGYARVLVPHFSLRVDASRLVESQTLDHSPIDLGRADACVTAQGFALCGDGGVARGHVAAPTSSVSEGRILYGGISVGYSTP